MPPPAKASPARLMKENSTTRCDRMNPRLSSCEGEGARWISGRDGATSYGFGDASKALDLHMYGNSGHSERTGVRKHIFQIRERLDSLRMGVSIETAHGHGYRLFVRGVNDD